VKPRAAPPLQVPHLDARVATKTSIKVRGIFQSVRVLIAAIHDKLRTSLGFTPGYIPLAGPPGSLAIMQLSEFENKEWKSKHPSVYQVRGLWPFCYGMSWNILQ
jgi:hypothetical protein